MPKWRMLGLPKVNTPCLFLFVLLVPKLCLVCCFFLSPVLTVGLGLGAFLTELGLSKLQGVFENEDIDMGVLKTLSEEDLTTLGLSMGHRRTIISALQLL